MKGIKTLVILEAIAGSVRELSAVFEAVLRAGYGASLSNIEYQKRRIEYERSKAQERCKEEQQFYNLIYKLKRDGLLLEEHHAKQKRFKLSLQGASKLAILRKRMAIGACLPAARYHMESGDAFLIVVFDIPEKERRKRAWLRSALTHLGLTMVQKSVWTGKGKLPRTFLEDLKQLHLLNCVEIFEISKSGSLRNVA